MALPHKLKVFNVFNDGDSYIGQTTEVALPKLAIKAEAYRSGGMIGEVDIDLGLEKMEMEHTYGGPVRQIFNQFGLTKTAGVLLRFMGSYQRDDTAEIDAYEVVTRGRHIEIDMGSAKAGDDTTFKVKTSISYFKLTINNEVVIEIDMENMIYVVNGEDRYAAHRKAVGL